MKYIVKIFSIASVLFAYSALAAEKFDWSPCKTEIDKWCKNVKEGDDEAMYQCLLKNDADLSKDCDNKAHSKYEEKTCKVKK